MMVEPYWSAKQGGYIKCPVDGCNHTGIIITAAHCRMAHNMTRAEVQKEYGIPKGVSKLNRKQIESLRKGANK